MNTLTQVKALLAEAEANYDGMHTFVDGELVTAETLNDTIRRQRNAFVTTRMAIERVAAAVDSLATKA